MKTEENSILERLGWNNYFEEQFIRRENINLEAGRVVWENRGFYKSVLGLCPTARYNISVEKGQFRKEHDPWRN